MSKQLYEEYRFVPRCLKLQPKPTDVVQVHDKGFWSKRMIRSEAEKCGFKCIHRLILPSEVVFDIDVKDKGKCWYIADKICRKLAEDRVSYVLTDTSNSYHIHTTYPELSIYPPEARKLIKRRILKHYSRPEQEYIDFAKVSERVLIRDIGSKHEKTGKYNKIEFDNNLNYPNKLPHWAKDLSQLKDMEVYKSYNPEDFKGWLKNDMMFQYALNNRMPKGGRKQILCKNFAIGLYHSGIKSKRELVSICKTLARNCDTEHFQILSWLRWVKEQKASHYNLLELNGYIRRHELPIECYEVERS